MKDIGVYSCKATNALGSDEASILVEVRGRLSGLCVNLHYIPLVLLPIVNCRTAGFICNYMLYITACCMRTYVLYVKYISSLCKGALLAAVRAVIAFTGSPQLSYVLGTFSFDALVPLLLSTAPPVIVGGPTELSVVEGRTVRLQCNSSGDPTPTIIWIKDGKQLETEGRIFINPISGQLEVLDAKQEDAGQYMCRAINELGATSYTISLKIRGKIGGSFNYDVCCNIHCLMRYVRTYAYSILVILYRLLPYTYLYTLST